VTAWYHFAQGPLLRFALVVAILGLLRSAMMAVWGMIEAIHHARDKSVPYGQVLLRTVGWLFPFRQLPRERFLYSFISYLFHLSLLGAALLLFEHIALIRRATGVGWGAVPRSVSDVLAGVALASVVSLLVLRAFSSQTRRLSSAMDYFLLVLLAVVIGSGMIASRAWNPFTYAGTMFVHVSSGALLFLLTPFTKLAHCVLFGLVRLGTEIAWHFRPGAGRNVLTTLTGSEERVL